jgi:hypothetical protein
MFAKISLLSSIAALIGFTLAACPLALAQGDPGQRPVTRLARPGEVAPAPSGNQPFTLGAAQNRLATPDLDTALQNRGIPTLDQGMQNRGTPALGLGIQKNDFPSIGVGMHNKEMDIPAISVQMLAKYNLELIVDQSMSMLTMDCPGFRSRWEWCGGQAQDLAGQLAPFVPNGFTITAFAKHYYVHPNSSAQNVADLFSNPAFGRGTRLAEPLADRLDNYFANRGPNSKPLLIAVITDGVPVPEYEPGAVVETLINASKRVKDPHEVTVVFFQIGGGDRKGKAFLHDLDTNLVNYGARYDIVHVIPFDHLEQVGLAQALVESIKDFAGESHGSAAGLAQGGRRGH